MTAAAGVTLHGEMKPGYDEILTPEALDFIADLHRTFGPRRAELLARREEIQARLDEGWLPDFLPETKHVRDGDWKIAPIPEPLLDRRVEITGPVDRKMTINALNSGARVFMADFEDSKRADLGQQHPGPHQYARRRARDDRLRRSGQRQALRTRRENRRTHRPTARLAPARQLYPGGRRADFRQPGGFRADVLPQRRGADRRRPGPVFLSAQAGESSGGAVVERCFRPCAEQARPAGRRHQGDRADRDDHGRLRDGRDPLRAEGPHRRP